MVERNSRYGTFWILYPLIPDRAKKVDKARRKEGKVIMMKQ